MSSRPGAETSHFSSSFLQEIQRLSDLLEVEIRRLDEGLAAGPSAPASVDDIDQDLRLVEEEISRADIDLLSDAVLEAYEQRIETLKQLRLKTVMRAKQEKALADYRMAQEKLNIIKELYTRSQRDEETALNKTEIDKVVREFGEILAKTQSKAEEDLDFLRRREDDLLLEEYREDEERKKEIDDRVIRIRELLDALNEPMPPSSDVDEEDEEIDEEDDVDSRDHRHHATPPASTSAASLFGAHHPAPVASKLKHVAPSRLLGVDAVSHAEFIRRIPQLFNEDKIINVCRQINEEPEGNRVLKTVLKKEVDSPERAKHTVNVLMDNAEKHPLIYYHLKLEHAEPDNQDIYYHVNTQPVLNYSVMSSINAHHKHECDLGEKISLQKILEGIRFLVAVGHKKIDLTQVNRHEKLLVPNFGWLTLLQIADAYSREIGLTVTQPERVPLYPIHLGEGLEAQTKTYLPLDDVDDESSASLW